MILRLCRKRIVLGMRPFRFWDSLRQRKSGGHSTAAWQRFRLTSS
ncbi:MAG: hypothetical protein ACXWBM_03140 [Chthoniobacterales bacterium]